MRRFSFRARLFGEVLLCIAVGEYLVMELLPLVVPEAEGTTQAVLDALLLSLLCAPLILWRFRQAAGSGTLVNSAQAQKGRHQGVLLTCLVVLLAGVGLTFWGASASRAHYSALAETRFNAVADRFVQDVRARLLLPMYGMNSTRGLFAASEAVSRQEFRAFIATRDLGQEFPGVRSVGYLRRVPQAGMEAFVQEARADGAPDFTVTPPEVMPGAAAPAPDEARDDAGLGRVVGPDTDRAVVQYVESNAAAPDALLGKDMSLDPVWQAALDRAARTGLPTLTRLVTLRTGLMLEPGMVWFLPLYQKGQATDTEAARLAALQGWVFAPVSRDLAFADIMGVAGHLLDAEIYDSRTQTQDHLLLDADNRLVTAADVPQEQPYGGRMFAVTHPMAIGGAVWTFAMTSTPKFEASVVPTLPAAICIGGLALTGVLVTLVWTLGSSRAQAIRLAEEMTDSLRASEAEARKLATVASRTDNAVVISDAHGRITWVNAGFTKLTGFEAAEAIGKTPGSLLQGPKTKASTVARMRAGLRSGKGFNEEVLNYHKDGSTYWVNIELQPLHDEAGTLTGYMAIERDITARRQWERELEKARQTADSANRAKSEFLAVMSHEIRTPLNGVIGMTSLLLDTQLDARQREFTDLIRSSGETLLSLINDILDFSKIESGHLDLECARFDTLDCVESALDVLALQASRKGLDLLYEVKDGVPACVKGDITRLRQVLVNLVSNAIKFTEQGEVVVTVQSQGVQNELHELLFTVRDTGMGIPLEAQERLFRSFSQVDASVTRKFGGTGLGLAISRRIAELMGGRMWVESTPDQGSTFSFTILIPAAASEPRPFPAAMPEVDLTGRRLLVVDDNATNRRILTALAEKWGIAATTADCGATALELLATAHDTGRGYDFAILDLHMPVMDGVTLGHEIHQRYGDRSPPLILLSSVGLPIAERDRRLFTLALTKPAKSGQVHEALMQVIRRAQAQAQSQAARPGSSNAKAKPATGLPPLQVEVITDGTSTPLTVLLAEDNSTNQMIAQFMLAKLGCKADVAANGLEVLEAMKRHPYEIILMDVQMPEMDGYEATRSLRATALTQPPPGQRPWIIALTANAVTGDRERCLEAGMDDYLSKPLNRKALEAALNRAREHLGLDCPAVG